LLRSSQGREKFPVSGAASGEIHKTMPAWAWQGIGNFCRSGGQRDTCAKSRTYGTAQVLSDLQRKGHVRQRSIAADLIFLVLFVSRQKGLGPAAIERQEHHMNPPHLNPPHRHAHEVSIIDLVVADLSL